MGTSARTLQRRLMDAGLTFQQVLEHTRRELARHYLQHSAVDFNAVAYFPGYEHADSSFRAFQGWEGTPPREWRSAHGGRQGVTALI
jgi:transcriptional regulator GlxA family with amidase domain